MKKALLQFVSFISLCFFAAMIPQSVQANEKFDIDLKTAYNVQPNGITNVSHSFQITNKQPLYSVSQYGITVSSVNLDTISVAENGKQIDAEVVTTTNQTSIGITFPEQIVGENKTRNFSISYQDPDAAIISGKVLEVAVPRIQNFEEYSSYQVELVTPTDFGAPTRVIPTNYESRVAADQVTTTFNSIRGESIVALFGSEQVFEMTLQYHLENPHNGRGITQIALPPDTAFQKMYYYSLEPKPQEIEQDNDGNWIATYLLEANEVLNVTTEAQAHITLTPHPAFLTAPPTKELTAGREFWDIHNQVITETATNFSKPRDAYNYVVQNLEYNYNRLDGTINRLGAVATLQSPDQALCQEFTDAFIALSRASGSPSRRITGYAHTENSVLRPLSLLQDVLHSWPEYYDAERQLWVPVDPTWEHTSGGINYFDQFDLNHVVFAINGTSSDTPYPAGSYKLTDQKTKDVEVRFGSEVRSTSLKLAIQPQSMSFFNNFLAIPYTSSLKITNETGQAFYNVSLIVQSNDPNIHLASNDIITIESLLPFQTISVPVAVTSTTAVLPETAQLTINYAEQQQEITISTLPKFWNFFAGPELLITMGVITLVFAVITGGVLVFRRKK
jgi:transglutaminase-like putative cysteine protease